MRERIVRAVAGTMVLISITLALFVNIYWLGLAAFVGLNLLQSSFTHFVHWKKYWIKRELLQEIVSVVNTPWRPYE